MDGLSLHRILIILLQSSLEYGTEQGLAALIYGEKGLSSLPIQDIAGEHINTDNEYMYYYSVCLLYTSRCV